MHLDFARFCYSNLTIKVVDVMECASGEVVRESFGNIDFFQRERPRLRDCIVLSWRGEGVQDSHILEFLKIYLVSQKAVALLWQDSVH